ncbi:hypothetical protein [Algicola sagamiensis]|uniref:hypothetical protein n=1 Tax=Algicola sagamiensis TaxID=163869 RepID=UPI0003813932|nr:hypothetical protein [Algicola sagamiensis]
MKKSLLFLSTALLSTPVFSMDLLHQSYQASATVGAQGERVRFYENESFREETPVHTSFMATKSGDGITTSMDYSLDVSHFVNEVSVNYHVDAKVTRSDEPRISGTLSQRGVSYHHFRATGNGVLVAHLRVIDATYECPERKTCLPMNANVSAYGNRQKGVVAYDIKKGFRDGVDTIQIPVEEGKTYYVRFNTGSSTSGGIPAQHVSAKYNLTWSIAYDSE